MKCRQLNSKEILKSKRFDGSYHNADVNIYNSVITSHSSHTLSYYCSEIFTSGRNKRVYTKAEFGDPFLSNSDASSSDPFNTCKYSSKKYGYDESALLKGGMILTGRVGAIGQTVFVPTYWEKYRTQGSDNIIRIVVKHQFKNGFIYAYLASKIGNLSFWKHATGGVQPFITDKMVGQLPIPDFSETFQQEVDNLVHEAARLREEAADAHEYAISFFNTLFPVPFKDNCLGKVSSKEIMTSINKRFEASFHISEGKDIDKYIKDNYEWKSIYELCSNISRHYIFKRNYVKNGITFLGGADIFLATPDSEKRLSKTKTENISQLAIKEGTILLPRSGTIGNVAWAHAGHAQKLASEDVIRLLPNDILRAGYVYAFLASKYGILLIQRYIFGSVIQHVEPPHLKLIPVPIIDQKTMDDIHDKIMIYSSAMGKAIEFEQKAIHMVEQEIEKWNKH
mgnify:CR=1 FL=1